MGIPFCAADEDGDVTCQGGWEDAARVQRDSPTLSVCIALLRSRRRQDKNGTHVVLLIPQATPPTLESQQRNHYRDLQPKK